VLYTNLLKIVKLVILRLNVRLFDLNYKYSYVIFIFIYFVVVRINLDSNLIAFSFQIRRVLRA